MRNMLLTLAALLALVVPAGAQADCIVPEVYLEALDEHQDTLLGYSIALNTGGGPLSNIDTAAVNYKLLMSMRGYHQDARATLPDCAQAVNTVTLDTIVTAQDAFALLFLNTLETESVSYERDLVETVAAFRETFGDLTTIREDNPLTPDE